MTSPHFRWSAFIAGSFVVIAVVFGLSEFLEGSLFSGAPPVALKFLHMTRGLVGSLLIMTLAIFFSRVQHRQAEEQLLKLSLAVEHSPSTVLITDARGTIEYVNPRFVQLTGYGPDEVIGKSPRILKSGQTPAEEYKRLWETISVGKEWRGEFLNKKKNGELYWEAASISPLRDPKGGITHFIGVLDDITERKKMEQMKDEFVGRMSHELQTPVALIKWSVENLKDGVAGALSTEQGLLIKGMSRHVSRLERVVNEVLDLTRLESGSLTLHFQRVDLFPLIFETVQNFQKTAGASRLRLTAEITPELPELDADPELLVQLLNNLLQNATRFAREKVVVRAEADGQSVHIRVIDDGPGIKPELLEKLFSKFKTIERKPGRGGYKGTGLGLVICREIVEKHSGKIWAESIVGQGAQFHVTLPLPKSGPLSA